ncbi:MAG: hypothetical protein WBO06_09870 [Gammaproteobacteria bacterium]|jgi:hypothetical protein
MTDNSNDPHTGSSGLFGVAKLIAATVIVLIAGLAVLVLFDVIPGDVFGTFAKKALLTASILLLASAAIALLMRSGK